MSQRITSSVTVQNLRQTHLTLEIHSLKLDPVASVISPYSQTRPAQAHGNAPCLLIRHLKAPSCHLRVQGKGPLRWGGSQVTVVPFDAKKQWSCCCQVASVVSVSVRPHRRQPTRLIHPWDSPGKNIGVGCHSLLQCMHACQVASVVSNSVDPIDSSPPGSCVHRILQARILEWVAISFSRGPSQPRFGTCVSYISSTGRQVLYHHCHRGSPKWKIILCV